MPAFNGGHHLAASGLAACLLFCPRGLEARPQQPLDPPPLEKIAEVRRDEDRDGVPDRLGERVAVAGRATLASGVMEAEGLHVFIEGAGGGILLRASVIATPIADGDSVEAEGTVAQANGVTQLRDVRYRVVSGPRRVPQPLEVPLAAVAQEAHEGRLLRTRGKVGGRRSMAGGQILLLSTGDTKDPLLSVFLPPGLALDLPAVMVGDELSVTGILGQFDRTPPYSDFYLLYPRTAADLRPIGIAPALYRRSAVVLAAIVLVGLLWVATLRAQVKRRTREMEESEERYRLLVEHSPEPIAVYRKGRVAYANPAAARLVGAQSVKQVLGQRVSDFIPSREVRGAAVRSPRESEASLVVDRVLRLDGTVVDVEAVSLRISYGGEPAHQVVLRDISERRHADERLLHDAFHDSLTGLANRALFNDRLEQAIKHHRRHPGYAFAVLFLDLDRFKVVNDSLGHLKGDELLVVLAGRLQQCLREQDTVARLGGDEFAVLADDIQDVEDATRVADRILEELRTPTLLDGHEIVVGASIGIAVSFTGYDRPEELLRDADTAMYRAKAAGIGGYEVFDREMHASAVALLRLETELRRALDRGELRLHYQPILSLQSGVLEGFEALLRWQHPERGLVLPGEFIRVAEETGLIVPIGRWALREACLQARAWREEAVPISPLSVHVNMSGRQLMEPGLASSLAELLAETGVAPGELKLEITESVVMRDAIHGAGTLEALKELGVELCIDDFGTGYSSLSYLDRFPVDVLKVDRSFVSGAGGVSWNIVRAILTLARDMGKRVIAEGVETPEQLGALRALGVPSAQGYLFSAAVPGPATQAMVEAWDLLSARRAPREGEAAASAPEEGPLGQLSVG